MICRFTKCLKRKSETNLFNIICLAPEGPVNKRTIPIITEINSRDWTSEQANSTDWGKITRRGDSEDLLLHRKRSLGGSIYHSGTEDTCFTCWRMVGAPRTKGQHRLDSIASIGLWLNHRRHRQDRYTMRSEVFRNNISIGYILPDTHAAFQSQN